jgi:cellulose synthase/poly-beta-1,6-N-acetylglucosamine synthase-like glycosyltransferase
MLRALLWVGQVLVVVPVVYSTVVSLWGFKNQKPVRIGTARRRIRAVVSAHDEASVIAGIAQDLASQTHDSELLAVAVIADRCTDDTAARAGEWVPVVERPEGHGAKGAAVAWYLDRFPLDDDEYLLVLDADNRIDETYVATVAAALGPETPVVQTYLDVLNPDESVLASATALTYWASNRSVQLARTNLGWSCDLGGTGMAISARVLADAGGVVDTLAEDLSLNLRLNLAGHRSAWLHEAKVRDHKTARPAQAVTQRSRWVRGRRQAQRAHGRELITHGFRSRSGNLLDLAFRLYNPGRSFLVSVVALFAVAAAIWPDAGWLPWPVLAAIAGVALVVPLALLVKDHTPARYVLRYPLVVLIPILWLPIRILSLFNRPWRRTDHSG